jgi:hypothetical protein
MLVLPLLFAVLYLHEPSRYLIGSLGLPPLFVVGSAVGGFLFGIFMHYSGGGGAGIFYEIAEINSGAIIAVIGFIAGFFTEKGILKFIREASQGTIGPSGAFWEI